MAEIEHAAQVVGQPGSPASGSSTVGRVAAAVAGAAAIATAIYHVASPGAPTATFGSFNDYVRDLLFMAFLAATIVAVTASWRLGVAPRLAAMCISFGYGLIGVGVLAGLLLQEDPDWFFLLGGPGNLLAVVGFAVLAVVSWRRKALPLWAAALCGVGGLVAVVFAEFGTSVLIGSFWLYMAASRLDGCHPT